MIVPVVAVTRTGTVISGKEAPEAITAEVVQVMICPETVQVHPAHVGGVVETTPAGRISFMVVTPVVEAGPSLLTMTL